MKLCVSGRLIKEYYAELKLLIGMKYNDDKKFKQFN